MLRKAFVHDIGTYDVIMGNGGDVVIANFALRVNPEVTSRIIDLIKSGKVRA